MITSFSADFVFCDPSGGRPLYRAGAMSLNQVVPKVAKLRIGWFHSIKSQKSSGSIAPFSKIEWFHGTTGTTTNAGPGISYCKKRKEF